MFSSLMLSLRSSLVMLQVFMLMPSSSLRLEMIYVETCVCLPFGVGGMCIVVYIYIFILSFGVWKSCITLTYSLVLFCEIGCGRIKSNFFLLSFGVGVVILLHLCSPIWGWRYIN